MGNFSRFDDFDDFDNRGSCNDFGDFGSFGDPNYHDIARQDELPDSERCDGTECMPPHLFDMHCHLDFGEDPQALAADLQRVGIGCLSATVAPDAYAGATSALSPYGNVRVGLGLHPWWVEEGIAGRIAVDTFCQLAGDARFVAEVGLDFGSRHESTRSAQLAAFKQIARTCAEDNGHVMSVHAVKSADAVLDILTETGALSASTCIFHWFSGTSDELAHAIHAGAYFSVNPHMLETKRGRAYAQAIPASRLLLETDEPAAPGAPFDALAVEHTLKHMLSQLAALRRCSYDELEEAIARTSKALLDL